MICPWLGRGQNQGRGPATAAPRPPIGKPRTEARDSPPATYPTPLPPPPGSLHPLRHQPHLNQRLPPPPRDEDAAARGHRAGADAAQEVALAGVARQDDALRPEFLDALHERLVRGTPRARRGPRDDEPHPHVPGERQQFGQPRQRVAARRGDEVVVVHDDEHRRPPPPAAVPELLRRHVGRRRPALHEVGERGHVMVHGVGHRDVLGEMGRRRHVQQGTPVVDHEQLALLARIPLRELLDQQPQQVRLAGLALAEDEEEGILLEVDEDRLETVLVEAEGDPAAREAVTRRQ
ncbi:hypothetical protein QFZ66_002661 [Streptomyces sp. B4I13]|nr:hypothetical protein [Streptomyces sp. B4I13]